MSHDQVTPMKVVLCWHMHQPQYQNQSSRHYKLPWTYLHGIKDYVDMAVFLERNNKARAVFNFTPVLLDQISDYAAQIRNFFEYNTALNDPLLSALISPTQPKDEAHYLALIKQCLKANEKHLIERFPVYKELARLADFIQKHPLTVQYSNGQFLSDLLTWYHLAWFAETTRESDSRLIKLIEKGHGFTMHERLLLLRMVGEQLESIIPRYRRLMESGQIELSMTPYAHPIVPLMLDFASAKEAIPDIDLPAASHYPGGLERAQWHIEKGLQVFEAHFGIRPVGCWPSEGAISTETLKLLDQTGFRWIASGQEVLNNSLKAESIPHLSCLHRRFSLAEQNLSCFFRDDHLSDLIGFTYQNWHGDDAVANFVCELENIAKQHTEIHDKVVSIILDGENCWEYYPNNGIYFLTALYEKLSDHPFIELTTFSDVLDPKHDSINDQSEHDSDHSEQRNDQSGQENRAITLPKLVSGSWVYGTLSTWMGDADKNKAWDALVKAKHAYDQVINSDSLNEQQKQNATEQLAICEGSDWFWWFGDYNPEDSVSDFESLYREHLANLYRFLGKEIPEELTKAMSRGSGEPENAGVMRRSR